MCARSGGLARHLLRATVPVFWGAALTVPSPTRGTCVASFFATLGSPGATQSWRGLETLVATFYVSVSNRVVIGIPAKPVKLRSGKGGLLPRLAVPPVYDAAPGTQQDARFTRARVELEDVSDYSPILSRSPYETA